MEENFYQILQIPRDADERMIKRAYHRLARELHPDKAESAEQAREFEQRFARVSTAYNVLKDADQRKEYDRKTFGPDGSAKPAPGPGPTPTGAIIAAARAAPAADKAKKTVGLTPQRQAIAQKAYLKGIQLVKEKDFAKAAEFFEAAIANNDTEPSYHAQLGHALIRAKRSATRAIEAAERAIELDKYNLDFKFNLAEIYQTIGSTSNALKVLEEILRWDENNEVAKQMLRELTGKKGGFLQNLRQKFSK